MIALFFGCYVFVFSTIAFGVSTFSPDVFPLLAPGAYHGAAVIAPSLMFAFVADGVMRISGIGAELAKRTTIWAVVSLTHVAVAFPLTWVLLPRLGILGAAIALLLASLVATIVCHALVQRVFPLSLPVWRALFVIVAGSIGATTIVATTHGGAVSVALRLAATAVFGAIAFRIFRLDLATLRAVARGVPPSTETLQASV